MNSILQSRRALEHVSKAFSITKNIPLDYRFIINSLDTIDTEIPLRYRYNGLVFFVVDAKVSDGTHLVTTEKKIDGTINIGPSTGTKNLSGILYVFEDDLNKPIPLHDTVLRFIIRELTGYNNNYTNLVTDLDHTYAKAGSIVYIPELGISVIFDGYVWKYLSGIYTINDVKDWDTLPNQFKIPNTYVFVGANTTLNVGVRKIVLSDLSLSDEILIDTTIPAAVQNNRYYLINGYLHYSINGKLYQIGDKLFIINTTLVNGSTLITHYFNTEKLIYAFVEMDNPVNNKYEKILFPVEVVIVNVNQIIIQSAIEINMCKVYIISKE